MRQKGITLRKVRPVDPDLIYGPCLRYAVGTDPDGTEYILCDEGVGHPLTDDDGEIEESGETVDLADFIRTFGQRLESNFSQWAWKLSGGGS